MPHKEEYSEFTPDKFPPFPEDKDFPTVELQTISLKKLEQNDEAEKDRAFEAFKTRGFVYLAAVIDWYSRRVPSWRISNSMDASFCVDCLEDALRVHAKPEVFNSDQGSQFTSNAFTGVLKREGIAISMDGRGRALDNIFVERLWRSVKYEDVYLQGYGTMGELTLGLARYFAFYNGERPHQSLGNWTPHEVYASGQGGGAKRGGSGNSDSWISGGLASQSRSQDRIQEQEHDEENKT